MTRRRFTKKLISYGYDRKQIDGVVQVITKNSGKLSYNDSIKEITMQYVLSMLKTKYVTFKPIDYFKPFLEEPVNTEIYRFSDLLLCGSNLARVYKKTES